MSADAIARIHQLLATPEPPELGPGPRANAQPQAALNSALDMAVRDTGLPAANQHLIRALLLLWHDHLEAAHVISQGIENPDGSLVHAIMHRREPDYSNSKYWWRRVGRHPCFSKITRRVTDFMKSKGERDLAAKLSPRGEWDAFAFVDACEAAAGLPAADTRVRLLREIQRIESECALARFLESEAR